MDRWSKYLLVALLILVLISVFLTYRRAFVSPNFEIISEGEVLE